MIAVARALIKVFALAARISGKFAANHATFSSHKNQAFPTAYNLRTKSTKSKGSERIGPRRAIFGLFPPWPVNRSTPKTPGILPKRGPIRRAERADHFETGGGKGTEKVKLSDSYFSIFSISYSQFALRGQCGSALAEWLLTRGVATNICRSPPGQAREIRDDNALPPASDDPSMRQPRQFARNRFPGCRQACCQGLMGRRGADKRFT
jgi:hypothetical protein